MRALGVLEGGAGYVRLIINYSRIFCSIAIIYCIWWRIIALLLSSERLEVEKQHRYLFVYYGH